MEGLAEPLATPRSGIARFVRARPLTTFFVLTYLWSWALWEAIALLPEGLNPSIESFLGVIFIAGIFRRYDLYDPEKKGQSGPTLELYKTTRADVAMHADYITDRKSVV